MNRIAIIPARGGSQRIPNKNIKEFFGKPIIAYSIEVALKSKLFEEVIVSTDSTEIATIAKNFGASVPFLRSEANSNNHATLSDVLVEVMQNFIASGKKFDAICCILPTAALITQERIKEAYALFKEKNLSSVIPVVKFAYPIQRALRNNNGLLSMRESNHITTRSQDLESFFHDSGQFYWIETEEFLKEKSIFTTNTGFIELLNVEAQDVDTTEDWDLLTVKYNYKNFNFK